MKTSKLVETAFVALGLAFVFKPSFASQANPQPAAQHQQAAKPATVRPANQAQANPQAPRPAAVQAQSVSTNQAVQPARRSNTQVQRLEHANLGGISCVPYVRQATGMAIRGNGGDWWHNAAGLYARGHAPEAGAILAFSRTGQMRSGHVAVVQEVISAREIRIHHANWAGPGIRRGSIMQDVSVIDVSLNNDWSSVRVQVGRDQESLGRIYPIQGFIYDRPDNGNIRTAATPRAGGSVLAHAQSLRPNGVRGFEEVAQAPARR
ncbi:MAG: CHAP domain-containing protein [Alphaproteobacteria bacterium]|nr:CHAP domain-containing protein [Alphaproteobacteria bacterium]